MLMIPEEGSFELRAYVETPGYIRIIPKGFLVSKRQGETWIAPLIPQLFYGATGQQLTTWRQHIPQAGEQVVLSRRAGEPKVPREELFWRKVTAEELEEVVEAAELPPVWWPLAAIGGAAALILVVGVVAYQHLVSTTM